MRWEIESDGYELFYREGDGKLYWEDLAGRLGVDLNKLEEDEIEALQEEYEELMDEKGGIYYDDGSSEDSDEEYSDNIPFEVEY